MYKINKFGSSENGGGMEEEEEEEKEMKGLKWCRSSHAS